jgi:hypothetical protein
MFVPFFTERPGLPNFVRVGTERKGKWKFYCEFNIKLVSSGQARWSEVYVPANMQASHQNYIVQVVLFQKYASGSTQFAMARASLAAKPQE